MKRVRELDGLRCFAILGVIACHFRPVFRHTFDIFSIGWAGVELFFCISGFLITSILIGMRGSSHPYRTFYARRSLRIFPPYYLVLGVLVLALLLRGISFDGVRIAQMGLFLSAVEPHLIVWTLRNLISGHSLDSVTTLLDNHVYSSPLSGIDIFWSLSIEELFYLVWAPLVLRGSRRLLTWCAIAPLLLCPILRLFAHSNGYPEYFTFALRLDTLSAGACIALLFGARQRKLVSNRTLHRLFVTILPSSLAMFLLVAWQVGAFHRVEPRSTLLFTALGYTTLSAFFSSIVGLCVLHAGGNARALKVLRLQPMVFIGTISYMMYLIHIPTYLVVTEIGDLLALPMNIPGVGRAILSTLLTILLAWLSWRFFESRILRWKDAVFRKDSRSEAAEAALLEQPTG